MRDDYKMDILTEISNKYGGRVSALNRGTGGHNTGGDASINGYAVEYIKLFDKIKDDKINFLEIGIFQGRSLAMWSDYFSNGKIYGVDVNVTEFELMKPELLKMGAFKNDNLCGIIEGDSNDSTTALVIGDNKELYFDVIIDDGRHTRLHQLKTFKNFYF